MKGKWVEAMTPYEPNDTFENDNGHFVKINYEEEIPKEISF
jgi:hypothetical protein